MGNIIKIGRFFWSFKSIPGKQFVKGEGDSHYTEYAVIRDDATHTIKISDSMPLDVQLRAAAREALSIQAEVTREGAKFAPQIETQ